MHHKKPKLHDKCNKYEEYRLYQKHDIHKHKTVYFASITYTPGIHRGVLTLEHLLPHAASLLFNLLQVLLAQNIILFNNNCKLSRTKSNSLSFWCKSIISFSWVGISSVFSQISLLKHLVLSVKPSSELHPPFSHLLLLSFQLCQSPSLQLFQVLLFYSLLTLVFLAELFFFFLSQFLVFLCSCT